MKIFEAKVFDLDLELTMLNGDIAKLQPKKLPSSSNVDFILNAWKKLEENFHDNEVLEEIFLKKRDESLKNGEVPSGKDRIERHPFDLVSARLAFVYDKPKEWFADNFHIGTLNQVTKYISEEMTGFKKNSANSTPSKN